MDQNLQAFPTLPIQNIPNTVEMDAPNSDVEDQIEPADSVSNVTTVSKRAPSITAAWFSLDTTTNTYICKACEAAGIKRPAHVAKSKSGSTKPRLDHLKKKHPTLWNKLSGQGSNQPSLINHFQKKVRTSLQLYSGIDTESTREEIARYLVRTDAPFSLVDGKAFKRLVQYFSQQDVVIPSAKVVRKSIQKLFEEMKASLKKRLFLVPAKLSLTLDAWTSLNQVAVLGITVHWVDENCELQESVLACEEIIGPHTGSNMAEIVLSVLEEFNINNKVK